MTELELQQEAQAHLATALRAADTRYGTHAANAGLAASEAAIATACATLLLAMRFKEFTDALVVRQFIDDGTKEGHDVLAIRTTGGYNAD